MTEKFNVHLFALVRVKIEDIEADDMPAAIKLAEEIAPLELLCHHTGFINPGPETEYANEISHYLVDIVKPDGEIDEQKSRWFLDQNHMGQQHELEMNPNVETYIEPE